MMADRADRLWSETRLPEILLPTGRGLLVMLETYLDESERDGGIFCIAGFGFSPANAKKFSNEWRRLMGHVWPFHMVDLVAGRGTFKGLSQKERDSLLRAAVALINHRMTMAVAVSCRLHEVHALAPRWILGMGHAYALCCHLVMGRVGSWLRAQGRSDRVAYIFEDGYKARGEAKQFMARATEHDDLRDFYRYDSHAFTPKLQLSALQAADLFAWEWAKCYDETIDFKVRPMRRSLLALFKRDPSRYLVTHITGPSLRKFMSEVTQMGLAELRDRRANARGGASSGASGPTS